MSITTESWSLGMPYWDGIWDGTWESSPSYWEKTKMYCDLESRETIAMYEGDDGMGLGLGGDYDWCAYIWTEDGKGRTAATTGDLWWCLDDLLWGPMYWSWYHKDGRELTIGEHRQMRGLPADDLLYELQMIEIGEMLKNARYGDA